MKRASVLRARSLALRSCWLILVLTSQPASAATQYTVTDVGDLPGGDTFGIARSINAVGQIAGRGENSTIGTHGFLWKPNSANGISGAIYDIGDLTGGTSNSDGQGINASGQIAGGSVTPSGNRAFIWTPGIPNGTAGVLTNLGTLDSGPDSYGYGINNFGQIVGATGGQSGFRGFLWTPGSPNGTSGSVTIFDGFPGTTGKGKAFAINSRGQVVGETDGLGHSHGFIWNPTAPNASSGTMFDLDDAADTIHPIQARGINDLGQVVGHALVGSVGHAFLWSPSSPNGASGTRIDLGDLPGGSDSSSADSLNAYGQVVGSSSASGSDHAFIWTGSDLMLDLNNLLDGSGVGWNLQEAYGINDLGQIVGRGIYTPPDGSPTGHAFLLTPVPEPEVLGILGVAATVLLRLFQNPTRRFAGQMDSKEGHR